MPIQIECPSCEASFKVRDAVEGKKVRCPKCDRPFVAKTEGPAPRKSSRRGSRAIGLLVRSDDRMQSKAPPRRTGPVLDAEEEEGPPARKSRRSASARRPEKAGGLLLILLLGGGAAALLFLGVAGAGLWWLLRPAKGSVAQVSATTSTASPAAQPAGQPAVVQPAVGQPPVAQPPVGQPPVAQPPVGVVPKDVSGAQGKEFTPKNGRFTIVMPAGVRTAQRTRVTIVNRRRMPVEQSLSVLKDGTAFTAGSIGVPAVLMREIPADRRFDVFRDVIAKGRVIEEKNIEQKGIPGKDYQIEGAAGPIRLRMYLIGGFVLIAVVEGRTREAVSSDVANGFFDSFKLLNTT